MANYVNVPLGYKTTTQIPLNTKEFAESELLLKDLGLNNNLAFTYHKDLIVTCLKEDTKWKWREVKIGEENTGLLDIDFTYPPGLIVFGVDYSNKIYNFFPNDLVDGSETKINAGTNVTVTGNGTTATPYIINSSGGASVNDATSSIKGILRLTGDLGGTADAPTTPTAVHKTGDETIDGIKTFISRVDFQQSGTSSIGLSIATGSSYSQSFTRLLFNKDADGSSAASDMDNTITGALGNIGIKSSNFGFATLSTENIPFLQTRNFKLPSASGTLALDQNLQKVVTGNITISNLDNNHTIFINNGATPITITINSSITIPNFCVGFVQEGTGDVTFVGSGVSLTNPVGLKSKGQGYATFIERKLNTTSFFLLGDTKI